MIKMTNNNKGTYIPSIEAEEIYDMSVRGLENIMKYEYLGMIPYSLELIKLRSYKHLFSEKELIKCKNKNGEPKVKYESDAVINIKFKNKLKDGKQIPSFVREYDLSKLINQFKSIKLAIRETNKEIKESKNARTQEKLSKKVNYLNNKANLVKGHFKRIKADTNKSIYGEIKPADLRNELYVNGFKFKGRDYVFYKRTASKSRQSQSLFIREDLYDDMKEWSHMGLDLTGEIDVASLLAYESLVSSSITKTINIDPKSIFIINDEFSKLNCEALEVGNNLEATFNENATIINNIWDGQAIIDVSLMESAGLEKYGMAQLRQHFFKCASFSGNIQKFLIDNCPEGIDYDEWKPTDAFGNKIPAKQILLITTPSALKFLKYVPKVDNKKEQMKLNGKAFANWCKRVKKDKNEFGVCKHEKPSKYGDRSFTSYQMINTLDAGMDDIKELAKFEVDYILSLQGIKDENENFDEVPFIEYLEKKKDLTNAYEMLSKIYTINPEVVRTQMFRDYRTKQISNYKTKIKGGKLRQLADYATVVSNPYEMLLSVVGKLNKDEEGFVESHTLTGNQVYTTLHDFNKEYTTVRNPHNSANNFYKVFNKQDELIEKYFSFKNTPNIVVINAVKSPILVVSNGMDTDGDTLLIFKGIFNDIVTKTLEKRKYPIILNTIKSKPDPKELTNENIADIDLKTSKSQMWIGEVTNAAQFQVSCLWDIQSNEQDSEEKQQKIEQIEKNIAVLVVLSNVAIDYSKKVVEVDVAGALRGIRSSEATKVKVEVTDKEGNVKLDRKGNIKTKLKSRNKPNFWKYVSKAKVEREKFSCPMDLLIEHIDNDIEKATYRKNLPLGDIFTSDEIKGADDQQIEDIIDLVKEFSNKINKINSKQDDDKKCQERQTSIEDAYNELDEKLAKKKIRKATMYKLLLKIAKTYDDKAKNKKSNHDLSGIIIHLMNALYRTHGKTFLNLIKK